MLECCTFFAQGLRHRWADAPRAIPDDADLDQISVPETRFVALPMTYDCDTRFKRHSQPQLSFPASKKGPSSMQRSPFRLKEGDRVRLPTRHGSVSGTIRPRVVAG